MIRLKDVGKTYAHPAGDVEALSRINLTIESGQHVAIVGKSGSGKSTLLNLMAGIDYPTEGSISFHDKNLNDLSESDLSLWRGRNIGIVFQFYQLFPTLTVFDNILFAMNLVQKIEKRKRRTLVEEHLAAVGLQHKAKKFPYEISGGEQQRVAIARAMANEPALIIADEPTGNLDSQTGQQINRLFDELNIAGTTIVTVTHANIVDRSFDRVLQIHDGRLLQ